MLLLVVGGHTLLAVGLTWWIWYREGRDTADDLVAQLRRELSTRIAEHVRHFVSYPNLVNQLNEDAHALGQLDLSDLSRVEPHLFRQLKAFRQLSYIDLGTVDGQFIGLERMADGSINLERVDDPASTVLHTYKLDERRRRVSHKQRRSFVVQQRPWYRAAVVAGKPTWTGIYPFFSVPARLGITAVRPLRDADGKLVGVLGADVVLTHLSDFLRELLVGESGQTFIIERDGRLVASSSFEPCVLTDGKKVSRIDASDFSDLLIRAAAVGLQNKFSDLRRIDGPQQLSVDLQGHPLLLQVSPLTDVPGIDWLVVVAIPRADFMWRIDARTKKTLTLFAVVLAVSLLMMLLVTRRITRPIAAISRELHAVEQLDFRDVRPISSRLAEIRNMVNATASMKRALRSLEKYAPADVVRLLIKSRREAVLEVAPAEVTMFFSDIAGFTTLCEKLPPERLVEVVGEYMGAMSRILLESRATISQYIGDAIMAFWNAPESIDDHPLAACRCALASRRELEQLQGAWKQRGLPALEARIGIHSGEVLVGNLGSEQRMNYQPIGDTVNLASRLEGLNKVYGTSVIISDAVERQVAQTMLCRTLDLVAVKGKSAPTRIFELIAERDDADATTVAHVAAYETAFERYLARDFDRASVQFAELNDRFGADPAAELLRRRCQEYAERPPADDWDGVHQLRTK